MITEDQKALALIAASLMGHEELDYKQAIGRAMTLVEEAEAQLHDKAEENRWASTSGILPPNDVRVLGVLKTGVISIVELKVDTEGVFFWHIEVMPNKAFRERDDVVSWMFIPETPK